MTTLQDKWYREQVLEWMDLNDYTMEKLPGSSGHNEVSIVELNRKVVLMHDNRKMSRIMTLFLKNVGNIVVSLNEYMPKDYPVLGNKEQGMVVAIDVNGERKFYASLDDVVSENNNSGLWTQVMKYAKKYIINTESEFVNALIKESISLECIKFFDFGFHERGKIFGISPDVVCTFENSSNVVVTSRNTSNFENFLDTNLPTSMVVSAYGRFIALLTNSSTDGELKLSLHDLYDCKTFVIQADNIGCTVDSVDAMKSLIMTAIANDWHKIGSQLTNVALIENNILNWKRTPSFSTLVTVPKVNMPLTSRFSQAMFKLGESKVERIIHELSEEKYLKTLNDNNSENPYELKSLILNDTSDLSNKSSKVFMQFGHVYTFSKADYPNYNIAVEQRLSSILRVARLIAESTYGLNTSPNGENQIEYNKLLKAASTIIDHFRFAGSVSNRKDFIRELINLENKSSLSLEKQELTQSEFDKIMTVIEHNLV